MSDMATLRPFENHSKYSTIQAEHTKRFSLHGFEAARAA
jgi:hypothetical protein